MSDYVVVVVVTFNRMVLLRRCLLALVSQTRMAELIVVIDNASTDGTARMLRKDGWYDPASVHHVRLQENRGGAGGFSEGVRYAMGLGADWVWIMDDDAVPAPDSLEKLLARRLDPNDLYASVAISNGALAWPMERADGRSKGSFVGSDDLPAELDVAFAPFLGLLVSAEMVRRIGVPDADYFIAADDVEYCLRARKQGARVILVRDSHIEHPASQSRCFSLFGRRITTLRLAPWKRYYDVRNRLLVARVHHGLAFYYATIPGTVVRLLITVALDGDRGQQVKAFMAGFVDGIFGRKGRRHDIWGLR